MKENYVCILVFLKVNSHLTAIFQITDSQPSSPVSEEPKDKLYQIAKELLDTERAYMAKLKLLDQVGI